MATSTTTNPNPPKQRLCRHYYVHDIRNVIEFDPIELNTSKDPHLMMWLYDDDEIHCYYESLRGGLKSPDQEQVGSLLKGLKSSNQLPGDKDSWLVRHEVLMERPFGLVIPDTTLKESINIYMGAVIPMVTTDKLVSDYL